MLLNRMPNPWALVPEPSQAAGRADQRSRQVSARMTSKTRSRARLPGGKESGHGVRRCDTRGFELVVERTHGRTRRRQEHAASVARAELGRGRGGLTIGWASPSSLRAARRRVVLGPPFLPTRQPRYAITWRQCMKKQRAEANHVLVFVPKPIGQSALQPAIALAVRHFVELSRAESLP